MDDRAFANYIVKERIWGQDYADEINSWAEPDDLVCTAMWTLKCLANPDCEGSEEAIAGILERRYALKQAKVDADRERAYGALREALKASPKDRKIQVIVDFFRERRTKG